MARSSGTSAAGIGPTSELGNGRAGSGTVASGAFGAAAVVGATVVGAAEGAVVAATVVGAAVDGLTVLTELELLTGDVEVGATEDEGTELGAVVEDGAADATALHP